MARFGMAIMWARKNRKSVNSRSDFVDWKGRDMELGRKEQGRRVRLRRESKTQRTDAV